MASTSWVCEFKAMTVGSLSTIPRPRVYTRGLAVPRSLAGALASPALPPGPVGGPAPGGVGRQGPQLAGELLDARLHAGWLACPQHQDDRAHQAQARGHEHVHEVAHPYPASRASAAGDGETRGTSSTSWAQVAQPAPPSHVS